MSLYNPATATLVDKAFAPIVAAELSNWRSKAAEIIGSIGVAESVTQEITVVLPETETDVA